MNVFLGCVFLLIIMSGVRQMTQALDNLKREVAESRGVAQSAILAISSIPNLIRDAVAAAVGDAAAMETALNELAGDLDASQADLMLAINQNPGPSDPGADTVSAGGDTDNTPGGDEPLPGAEDDDELADGQGNDTVK